MKLRVKIEGKTFDVEIFDLSKRPVRVRVDDEIFEVWPEEVKDEAETPGTSSLTEVPTSGERAFKKLSVSHSSAVATKNGEATRRCVTAPLPGVITSIAVREGDEVVHGQELLVLEAMKMKNTIHATRAGKIAAVHVSVGEQVQHGQPLVEFTE
jgi:biotin carboxyl carrier protein